MGKAKANTADVVLDDIEQLRMAGLQLQIAMSDIDDDQRSEETRSSAVIRLNDAVDWILELGLTGRNGGPDDG